MGNIPKSCVRCYSLPSIHSHIIPSADSLDSSSFILPWGLEEQPLGPVPVLNGLGMQGRPEKAWGFLSMCTDTRGTENPMVWEIKQTNEQTKACFTHISVGGSKGEHADSRISHKFNLFSILYLKAKQTNTQKNLSWREGSGCKDPCHETCLMT